jgi:MFS family permease
VNRIGSVIAGSGSLEIISKLLGLEFEQQMALLRAQNAYDGTILALGIMLLFGWLSDKFGERPVLILTLIGIGIGGAVPFVVRQGFYSLELQILSAGFCNVAISPGFNSWLSKIMSGKKMGIRYGIFSIIGTVGFYLLIPIQSFIPKRPQSIAVVAIVAFLAIALFIWFKFKLPAHSTEQENEMVIAG